jgi:hypothetical protein
MVVRMRMRDHGVADGGRVEPQFLQPADNFVFDGIVEQGVDQDDALRRRHRPGGVFALADEVKVVEYLHRLDIPRRPVRRSPGGGGPPRRCGTPRGARGTSAARSATAPSLRRSFSGGGTAGPRTRYGAEEVEQIPICIAGRRSRERHVSAGRLPRRSVCAKAGVAGILVREQDSASQSGAHQQSGRQHTECDPHYVSFAIIPLRVYHPPRHGQTHSDVSWHRPRACVDGVLDGGDARRAATCPESADLETADDAVGRARPARDLAAQSLDQHALPAP